MPSLQRKKSLCLCFTFGVSLTSWEKQGILSRETKPYLDLANDHGYEICFLTYGSSEDIVIAKKIHPIKVIPIFKNTSKPNNKFFELLKSIYYLLKHREKFANYSLLKSNQNLGAWACLILSRVHKKPFLNRAGYEALFFALKKKDSILKCILIYVGQLISYRSADLNLVATDDDANFCYKWYRIKDPSKIEIQPNWVDFQHFKYEQVTEDTKRNLRFLIVARFEPQKNLINTFQALVGLEIELTVVGSGKLEQELKLLSSTLGLNAKFLGNVPYHKLVHLYTQHDVFLLTSYYEGNPKVLIEAMACGMTCIGSNAHGIRSIINEAKNGYLTGTSPSEIRNTVNGVMQNWPESQLNPKEVHDSVKFTNSYSQYLKAEADRLDRLISQN